MITTSEHGLQSVASRRPRRDREVAARIGSAEAEKRLGLGDAIARKRTMC